MWKTASILVTIVLVLVMLGIIMLASTSSVHGRTIYKDSMYFIKRQLLSLFVGFIAAAILANVDYRYYRGFLSVFLGGLSVILLVMVLIPGIGINVNGSYRWLRFGPLTFQPSELTKFTTVLFLGWWMARIQRHAHEFYGVAQLVARLTVVRHGDKGHIKQRLRAEPAALHGKIAEDYRADYAEAGAEHGGRV